MQKKHKSYFEYVTYRVFFLNGIIKVGIDNRSKNLYFSSHADFLNVKLTF